MEGKTDLALQIVIPAHCLLFRTGINDCFVVDAVFPSRVSFGSSHDFAPRIRRTDFAATRCLDQSLASLPLFRTGTDFADLHGNGPAAAGGIRPQGAILHWESL